MAFIWRRLGWFFGSRFSTATKRTVSKSLVQVNFDLTGDILQNGMWTSIRRMTPAFLQGRPFLRMRILFRLLAPGSASFSRNIKPYCFVRVRRNAFLVYVYVKNLKLKSQIFSNNNIEIASANLLRLKFLKFLDRASCRKLRRKNVQKNEIRISGCDTD